MNLTDAHILLVEDHDADEFLVRTMLAQTITAPYTLTRCDLVQEALDFVHKHTPDLILLDLGLPDSRNFEGLRALAKAVPTVPIVVHSSLDTGPLLHQAIQHGAQDYLIKGNYDAHLFGRVIRYAIERNQVLQQTRASEQRLQTILGHTSDGILIVCPKGVVKFVNSAACDILGTTRDALSSQPLDVPIDTAKAHEWTVTHDNGTKRTVEVRYTPIVWDGIHAFVAALRDITLRKEREEELRRAKKAAEAMVEDKSAYLAQMTHDLRSPLTGIIGFAEALETEVGNSQQGEFASIIRRAGMRLLETINSVLDLSRLENKTESAQRSFVDVQELAQSVVATYRFLAQKKGLTLRLYCDESAPPFLSDRQFLMRILHNLVGNAIKYTEHGKVNITVSQTAAHLKLIVQDTGLGIAESLRARLFEAYSRASSVEQGQGLGLAITKKLVTLLDGTIEVQSILGQGSTFTVVLPTPEVHPPTATETHDSEADLAN